MNDVDKPNYLCCGAHMTVAEHNEWCLAEVRAIRLRYGPGEMPLREAGRLRGLLQKGRRSP